MKRWICIWVLVFGLVQAQAQLKGYENIKIDELSQEQVSALISEAHKKGLTDEQLLLALGKEGLSAGDQQKLRAKIEQVRKSNSGAQTGAALQEEEGQGRSTTAGEYLAQGRADGSLPGGDQGSRIFGADLFRNGDIRFEPNLNMPTPAHYVIGSGDQLLLDLSGTNEASYRLPVSPDGTIRVEYVGLVQVAGLTVGAAKSKIQQQMERVYPAMHSGNTKLTLTLGNVRSIRVTMTGQVTQPGTFTLPSLANVYHALYAAGGPSEKGTYRGIQLIRNNEILTTIDTYDFLTKGVLSGNIRLEDQDVIHIPVFGQRVSFDGAVKRPGIFEPVAGERFEDLLRYAGGFDTEAYTAKVKVTRVTDKERSLADIYANEYQQYIPHDGDQYLVEKILDRYANRVSIQGAVFRPGQYELTDGMSLHQLLGKADGLREDAFMGRAYINRLRADNSHELLTFDVGALLSGRQKDIVLQREDQVTIASIFDLRDQYTVDINGQIRRPGRFDYAENMTLGSLINMSGGLTEAANIEQIEVARRIRSNVNQQDSVLSELHLVRFSGPEEALNSDFVLQPFDIVSIRTSTGYQYQRQVLIDGEVRYPGVYTILRKDERISDLVRRAGGITDHAFLEGASLIRKADDGDAGAGISQYLSEQERMRSLATANSEEAGVAGQTVLSINHSVGIELDKILAGKKRGDDLILENGDVIIVPKQLETVTVRGQVLSPNRVVYKPGKSLRYYIRQAGGFTAKAHKGKTFVQHANGSVEGTSNGLFRDYPAVLPGTEIIVPVKPEREGLNTQSWIALGTGMASVAAIIVSLLR